MVISGEYALTPTSTNNQVVKSKQSNAPCDWVPLEPAAAYIGQIMLPKSTPHPYAALLFIDLDLSRQGGEIYTASGYDSPRKDMINTRQNYKKYYGPTSSKQAKRWNDVYNYFLPG